MNAAYLCLGGNIGDREVFLEKAACRIEEQAGSIKSRSSIYETEAWGVSGQQAYLNQCLLVETSHDPLSLLEILLGIEKELGRTRNAQKTYEPRTVDIDILLYNDLVVNEEQLSVPHPRMHLRRFVLTPLNDIASNRLHPVLNKTIFSVLAVCPDTSEVVLYKKM